MYTGTLTAYWTLAMIGFSARKWNILARQLRHPLPSSLPAQAEGHGAEDGREERRLGGEEHEANWCQLWRCKALRSSRE